MPDPTWLDLPHVPPDAGEATGQPRPLTVDQVIKVARQDGRFASIGTRRLNRLCRDLVMENRKPGQSLLDFLYTEFYDVTGETAVHNVMRGTHA